MRIEIIRDGTEVPSLIIFYCASDKKSPTWHMMNENLEKVMDVVKFTLPGESYERDISVHTQYVEQAAVAISKRFSISMEEARAYAVDKVRDIKEPVSLKVRVRDIDTEDTEEVTMGVKEYLSLAVKDRSPMTPSGTQYFNRRKKESLIAGLITKRAIERNEVKKKARRQLAIGDKLGAERSTAEQGALKDKNNLLTGLYNVKKGIFTNPSGHSTCTSVTRATTAIGNSHNEQMVGGNRLYFTLDVVVNHIVYISHLVRQDGFGAKIMEMVEKYGLKIPTDNDVHDLIIRSTSLYFKTGVGVNRFLLPYIEEMTPVERCAFVYAGDQYHLLTLNPSLYKGLIGGIIAPVTASIRGDDLERVRGCSNELLTLAIKLNVNDMIYSPPAYDPVKTPPLPSVYSEPDMWDVLLVRNPQGMANVLATYENIVRVTAEYRDFLNVFYTNKANLPMTAYGSEMIRVSGMMGDTDSTVTTGNLWREREVNNGSSTEVGRRAAVTVLYISSLSMAHQLACISGHMGVEADKMFDITMKSEYYWGAFALTSGAKTYGATTIEKEGSVYETPLLEIKGGPLRSSNIPQRVRIATMDLVTDILRAAKEGKNIQMRTILKRVADVERLIISSLNSGDPEFYRTLNIKGGYKLSDDKSNMRYYTFWMAAFSETYANMPSVPYTAYKIKTSLVNSTELDHWLENMQDRVVARNIKGWLDKSCRKDMKTIYAPIQHVVDHGIPPEILSVMDYTSIVVDLMKSLYVSLEMLNYFIPPKTLLSDLGY